MDLTVSIVNWNGGRFIIKCIDSVEKTVLRCSFQIYVVDNASTDESITLIKERSLKVMLIQNTVNVGYARAHNQVLSRINTPYVLLLNPDCECFGDTIDRVLDVMRASLKIGLAGCKVLFPDHTTQRTIINVPSLRSEMKRFLRYQPVFFNRLRRSVVKHDESFFNACGEPVRVKAIGGPFLMMRTDMLRDIGLLDEDYFLFSEEIDLCLRAERRNWQIVYVPSVSVTHMLGKCREKATTDFSEYHFQRSRLMFFLKHKRFSTWVSLCFISMFFCCWSYVVEILKKGVCIVLQRERDSACMRNIAARRHAIIDVIKQRWRTFAKSGYHE